LTDRWQNQRADWAVAEGREAEQLFGWSPQVPEPTSVRHVPDDTARKERGDHKGKDWTEPGSTANDIPDLQNTHSPSEQIRPPQLKPTAAFRQTSSEPSENPDLHRAYEQALTWSKATRSGKDPLNRPIPHLMIVGIVVAIVISSGFWSHRQDQPATMPGGTDNIQSVNQSLNQTTLQHPDDGQPQTNQSVQSRSGLIASASDEFLNGYLSTSSLSVTPKQLGVETYVTEERQTIASVAADTGVSEETLLWANDYVDSSEPLSAGTQLLIPPTDGVLHVVRNGDTLENIAKRYDVTPDVISNYEPNGIEHSADLVPNGLLMVPGGSMPTRSEVFFYTVREDDELWEIAERFGLHTQTILWANSLMSSNMISPGQQLAILPTDGVMVEVSDEDTIDSLAEEYGVSPSDIRDWPTNGLGADGSLIPGQSIMIPGGSPAGAPEPELDPEPQPVQDTEEPQTAAADDTDADTLSFFSELASQSDLSPSFTSSASGTERFIWPTTGVITQYFGSTHNGWDIADVPGTEVWAADSGKVIFSGWNDYGLGYTVAIDHGNGYKTWYGHLLEQPPVEVGQKVEQGEYIGPMGSTGYSTGPHVHFVIAYNGEYQDPGNYLR
jgi:murein DD-endopeptidase MepM/ murein hydrolase activator NlpD